MCIHIANIFGAESGTSQRRFHRAVSAFAFRRRACNMIGVAGHTIPNQFGVDLRAARFGMFIFFKNNGARAFAH